MIKSSQDDDGRYYEFLNKNQKDREAKSYAYQPYAQTYEYNQAPSAYVVQPVVQAVAPVSGNQYHAQDEAGQYSFGYSDPNSLRQEVSVEGVVRGGYKYVGEYEYAIIPWLAGSQSKMDRMILYFEDDVMFYVFNKTIRVGLTLTCLDSDGILQTVEYIADDAGFR